MSEKTGIIGNTIKTIDLFVKIHNFVRDTKTEKPDMNEIIVNLTKRLDKMNIGTCIISISDEGKESNWFLKFTDKGCKIEKYLKELANSEIIMDTETAYSIFSGIMSPTYAYGIGRIRIKGDIEILLSLYEKLVDERGILAPCRRLI